jgi:hypothetical protein
MILGQPDATRRPSTAQDATHIYTNTKKPLTRTLLLSHTTSHIRRPSLSHAAATSVSSLSLKRPLWPNLPPSLPLPSTTGIIPDRAVGWSQLLREALPRATKGGRDLPSARLCRGAARRAARICVAPPLGLRESGWDLRRATARAAHYVKNPLW